jgi:DNA adenine methylase
MHKHPRFPASRPCLKWVGGKRRVLSQLLPLLPLRSRLIEPFVGGGSVFLAADYDAYLLNDANADLISVWQSLKQQPVEFIARAAAFFSEANRNEAAYARIRAEFNDSADSLERAARFPYLNKFAFNGLFRVNALGKHNVPYAHPKVLPAFPMHELQLAAEKLSVCTVTHGGYAEAMAQATFGDAAYCDPPYSDSSNGDSFVSYTRNGFGRDDHEALVAAAEAAVGRGATVLISNHDTPETRKLYRGWAIHELSVQRSIASRGERRREVAELVAILRP